jgi:hypothetical protein
MDKITILLIVLFWVISALFRAIQKREAQKRKEPFSPPRSPGDRSPEEREGYPFFREEPDRAQVLKAEDLYNILEPQKKTTQGIPPSPISWGEQFSKAPVSLEELFDRAASQVPIVPSPTPQTQIPSSQIPREVQKERENMFIPEKPTTSMKTVLDEGMFKWEKNLSPWQRAIVLNEILQPPKSIRKR